jgi:hypothetical protein
MDGLPQERNLHEMSCLSQTRFNMGLVPGLMCNLLDDFFGLRGPSTPTADRAHGNGVDRDESFRIGLTGPTETRSGIQGPLWPEQNIGKLPPAGRRPSRDPPPPSAVVSSWAKRRADFTAGLGARQAWNGRGRRKPAHAEGGETGMEKRKAGPAAPLGPLAGLIQDALIDPF